MMDSTQAVPDQAMAMLQRGAACANAGLSL
jgi:hypothetical protein